MIGLRNYVIVQTELFYFVFNSQNTLISWEAWVNVVSQEQ